MPVMLDMDDSVIDIDDIGVTLRTLLAVAANGCSLNNKRKWGIRYKNAIIGSVQCSSTPRVPAKITGKEPTLR